MPASSVQLQFSTRGGGSVLDLTPRVTQAVSASGVTSGVVSVFVPGSTAAITAMEHEQGNVADLRALLDRLIPPDADWEHNRLNHDSNAHAHIRAALLGPSETFPIEAGRLLLGTWQQIVLVDFDDRPRERTVIVNILS